MKKLIMIAFALTAVVSSANAQFSFSFSYNNYPSMSLEDEFIDRMAYEYGVSHREIAHFLNRGFTMGDVIYGLELSTYSSYSFRQIMRMYERRGYPDWYDFSRYLHNRDRVLRSKISIALLFDHGFYWDSYWRAHPAFIRHYGHLHYLPYRYNQIYIPRHYGSYSHHKQPNRPALRPNYRPSGYRYEPRRNDRRSEGMTNGGDIYHNNNRGNRNDRNRDNRDDSRGNVTPSKQTPQRPVTPATPSTPRRRTETATSSNESSNVTPQRPSGNNGSTVNNNQRPNNGNDRVVERPVQNNNRPSNEVVSVQSQKPAAQVRPNNDNRNNDKGTTYEPKSKPSQPAKERPSEQKVTPEKKDKVVTRTEQRRESSSSKKTENKTEAKKTSSSSSGSSQRRR